jgi:4a-hydroxytetrahydrobiopterin dehydratase
VAAAARVADSDTEPNAEVEASVTNRVFSAQFHAADGAQAWRVLPEGAYAFFRTNSFAAAARFVDGVARLVATGRQPHIDLRPHGVTILLGAFKDEGYGLVQADLDLARAIATLAKEMDLSADPAAIQSLSVIPGATDRREIMPFWQAVLGYDPRPDSPDEDLVDPADRLAPFWFEEMDEPRADGGGTMHVVVWLPWDAVEARLAAALAKGGRLVRHNTEEGFWTLADPAGNEVDLATTQPPAQED